MALRIQIFSVLLSIVVASCAQKIAHVPLNYTYSKEDIDIKGMEKDILYYINEYRKSLGLGALQMLKEATTEAINHSVEMANKTSAFGHDGFDARIDNIQAQIGFLHGAGENVAYGKLSAKEVVDLWINSPPHKKNIVGDFDFTGIGVVKNSDGLPFYTQIFIRK